MPRKNLSSKLGLLFLSLIGAAVALPANAGLYEFSKTFNNRVMESYKAQWNSTTENLHLSSTYNDSKGPVTRIDFLLTDGGSPHLDKTEQFLFYSLDVVNNITTVKNYFGPRQTLEQHNGLMTLSSNGFSLDLGHSALNALTFPGYSYSGAGFTDQDIGIWHYVYSGATRVDTYDIHHGTPTRVPEPGSLALLGLGVLGLIARKRAAA